jgi:hypothetical protein
MITANAITDSQGGRAFGDLGELTTAGLGQACDHFVGHIESKIDARLDLKHLYDFRGTIAYDVLTHRYKHDPNQVVGVRRYKHMLKMITQTHILYVSNKTWKVVKHD